MSKALRTVATVASVVAGVALIGTGIGAALGGTMILTGVGSASSIAAIAGAVAGVAGFAAGITQKKPGVIGSATDITIGADMPTPYAMGRTYASSALVHDVGYGGNVSGVDNPYQSWVFVLSGGGPIQGIEAVQADFTTITFSGGTSGGEATGYYDNFLWLDSQLGACPESTALSGPFGAIPAWGASYKLSGYGAMLLTAKWDKKGKKYASGVPQWGAIVNGVLVYDQRQDDTYPGGEGNCRALDETSYVGGDAGENPSCHGVTYALGRWQGAQGPDGGPRKVMGCGFSVDAIDWPAWTEFANVCDANNWKIGGSVWEPGNRWDNLKRICAAGGGTPVWTGGLLSVLFPRPRVALDTIGRDDLADGEIRIPAMKGWESRLNGIIPKYPSEQNRWEMVQSDLISVETYVEEDGGEDKHEERDYELVPYKDQAAQLAAYDLANGREIAGILLPCKPRLTAYKIGDALETGEDLEEDTGLAAGTLLVITGRSRDPVTATVTLTLQTDTTGKHAFALGQTGTAPPSPSLPTAEEMDDAAATISETTTTTLIATSKTVPTAIASADDSSITIIDHVRRYDDKDVDVDGTTLTEDSEGEPFEPGQLYGLAYDDEARAGGAVPWKAYSVAGGLSADAYPSPAHPYRHQSGFIAIDVVGGTGVTGGGSYPPGGTVGGEISLS